MKNNTGKEVTKTERLRMREFIVSDYKFIFELLNGEDWKKYIGDRNINDYNDAESYISHKLRKGYKDYGFGMYAVCLDDDTVVGMCGLVKRDTFDVPDIGFAFLPKYYGNGYAFESAKAILDLAIRDFSLKNLLAICVSSNERSIHLIKKLGLSFEKKIVLDPKEGELELYSLTRNLQ
jgi:[ribosomal protein S5]-alanine N-acetyltransferase